jgi:hypothetical protein
MKKAVIFLLFIFLIGNSYAQTNTIDSTLIGTVTVVKDSRIDLFGQKYSDYNAYVAKYIKASKGYRLMLLSTNDRTLAMQVRSQLMQQFPEEKVHMLFQTPFIKIKFGDFSDKDDAEKYRKLILAQKIVSGNIYIVPETVEVRPDKLESSD